MMELSFPQIIKALRCCAPTPIITDDPDCARCPMMRDAGPAGQVWCSLEVMRQAANALELLSVAAVPVWVDARTKEPPDHLTVWIKRDICKAPELGYYVSDKGRWFTSDLGVCITNGEVTHWADYIPPEATGK